MRDKVEKARLGPWLGETAREARERLATETFNPNKVRDACTKAALEGFATCTVKPALPLNLRGTDAVDKLEDWLEHQGLAYAWLLGRDTPDGAEYPRLQVSWT